MRKKILITYASYGTGHKAAAEAIYDYLKKQEKNWEVKILDVMNYGTLIAKLNKNLFNSNCKHKNY